MKALKSKLVIFLCVPMFYSLGIISYPFEKSFKGICTEVLDGDTIVVNGKKVRLVYIDAPEKDQVSFDGISIGLYSADQLKKLIFRRMVTIKYSHKGHYGRIIGKVIYKNEDINLKMIDMGAAVLSRRTDDVRYKSANFLARLKRVGIYSTLGFYSPSAFRKSKRLLKTLSTENGHVSTVSSF